MRNGSSACPKCGGTMEEGFVRDSTYGGHVESKWVEGDIQKSFWTGLKLKGRVQHPITAHRCERCGFLEFYAKPRTDA